MLLSDYEETRPTAATVRRAELETTTGRASVSETYSTLFPRRRQVASFLRVGRSRGVKREDLAAMMGMDERALRRQIQRERKTGAVILADCKNGYFLPESPADVQAFIRQMYHRAAEIREICKAAEEVLLEMTGQTVIEGWADDGREE